MGRAHRRRGLGLGSVAVLAGALLAAGCGSTAGTGDPSNGRTDGSGANHAALRDVRIGGYLRVDGDQDNDDQLQATRSETDEAPLLAAYGPAADAADTRAITSLVKRYYPAALAGDAAQVCALLDASIISGLAAEQAPHAGARGCAPAMSRLLAQEHERLSTAGISTMRVIGAHVKGSSGLAIMGFRNSPEAQMVLKREDGTWKLDVLTDSFMP